MIITFKKKEEAFSILSDLEEVIFTCHMTNNVRNEVNKKRQLHKSIDVVRIVTKERRLGKPYMPRQFPDGIWSVASVEVNPGHALVSEPGFTVRVFNTNEFGTIRITTDAHQAVETWTLDSNNGYDHPDGSKEEDYGYHFHFAPHSSTTLGCGRYDSQRDAEDSAIIIAEGLALSKIISVRVE